MQAAIFEMFGISLPQSLMASPVHICWASDEKARPGDPERPVAEMAMAKVSASCCVLLRVMLRVPVIDYLLLLGSALAVCAAALDDQHPVLIPDAAARFD
jgi:hypothetical protein